MVGFAAGLILLMEVLWSQADEVQWICGEKGLRTNSGFNLREDKPERDRAVERIEDKIRELMIMAQQAQFQDESLTDYDAEHNYDYDQQFPHSSNQLSLSESSLSQTNARPNSISFQPPPVIIPSQPPQNVFSQTRLQTNYPNMFRSQHHVSTSRNQSFTVPQQVQSHPLPNRPALSPQALLFQFRNISSQTPLQIHPNSSLERNKPIKKLQLERNKPWTSRWFHPGALTAGGFDFRMPRYCDKLYQDGTRRDGVYDIIANGNRIEVVCEFQKNDHNWLVFQRREDGSIDFYKNWGQYDAGFGSKTGEFWLGLSNLHELTREGSYTLRVDLEDFDGNTAFAEYSTFAVESPSYNFRLSVNGYRGTAGDALSYHNGIPFSTFDRDHDNHYRGRNCAVDDHGAWWYNSCQHSNLNGEYLPGGEVNIRGIVWYQWKHNHYSMKSTTMKLRQS